MKYVALALLAGLVLFALAQLPLSSSPSQFTTLSSSSVSASTADAGTATDAQSDTSSDSTFGTLLDRVVRILIVAAGALTLFVLLGLSGLLRRSRRPA